MRVEYASEECFKEIDPDFGRTKAAFLHTYATVLVKSAEQKERIHSQDQEYFIGRISNARTALERALELARKSGKAGGNSETGLYAACSWTWRIRNN